MSHGALLRSFSRYSHPARWDSSGHHACLVRDHRRASSHTFKQRLATVERDGDACPRYARTVRRWPSWAVVLAPQRGHLRYLELRKLVSPPFPMQHQQHQPPPLTLPTRRRRLLRRPLTGIQHRHTRLPSTG